MASAEANAAAEAVASTPLARKSTDATANPDVGSLDLNRVASYPPVRMPPAISSRAGLPLPGMKSAILAHLFCLLIDLMVEPNTCIADLPQDGAPLPLPLPPAPAAFPRPATATYLGPPAPARRTVLLLPGLSLKSSSERRSMRVSTTSDEK